MLECEYYYCGVCMGQKSAPQTHCHGNVDDCESTPSIRYEENTITEFKRDLYVELRKLTTDALTIYTQDVNLVIEFYYHGQINYIHSEMCIESKILSGLTPEQLANQTIEKYKKIILHRHFK